MADPKQLENPTLADVLCELTKVSSSLHMGDERLPGWEESETKFLVDTFVWANHAYAHLMNAFDMVLVIESRQNAKEQMENFKDIP